MVYLYSGTPGSGKSLHMARDICDIMQYQKDALIIGNFPVNLAKIKHCKGTYLFVDNDELNPEMLKDQSREYFKTHRFQEGAIKLYIDECQLVFNAREWNIKGRAEWLSFFTQHRHLGYDIYLVAQFDRMVDRQIRSLIEYEVIHRRVSNIGIGGKVFSLVSGGKLFVAVWMWYPLHERLRADFYRYKRKYGSIYDSYALLDELQPAAEAGEGGTPADAAG